MMGENHIKVNFHVGLAYFTATSMMMGSRYPIVSKTGMRLTELFIPRTVNWHMYHGFFRQCAVYMIFSFLLFMLGTLLPDIDSKKSLLGRYIYLPIKHRRWTHTVWVLLGIFPFAVFFVYIRALWVGYFLHLLLDAVSAAGVCWIYPIHKYIEYDSGAFVAPNHKHKWYHAGKDSEKVLANSIMLFCLFFIVYFGIVRMGLMPFCEWVFY